MSSEKARMPLAFADHLEMVSEGKMKGERTRARIMIAACKLLDAIPPSEIKVSNVCKHARIAHGTFYIYFNDVRQLLSELLLDFVDHLQNMMKVASHDNPDGAIRGATRIYGQLFRSNAGLMKCLLYHQDGFPGARHAFHALNQTWLKTVIDATRHRLEKLGQGHLLDDDELTRRAYALGAMTDQYFASLYLSNEDELMRVSRDDDAVACTLSLIWERGLQP